MNRRVWGKRPGLFVSNSRFYLLVFVLLLSLLIAGLLRDMVVSDQLYIIRLQQVFGFSALGFWYIALLATPLAVIVGKRPFMRQYLYLRRALGVSAAYFAILHMLTGLFGQLGGISGVLLLPSRFQLALAFGLFGVLTLTLMAVTSFDTAIRKLTFPRWKWLHRVGYLAGILVYLHVWMIGTHIDQPVFMWTIFGLLSVLGLLEAWRMSFVLEKLSGENSLLIRLTLFVSVCMLFVGFVLIAPKAIKGYHQQHNHAGVKS